MNEYEFYTRILAPRLKSGNQKMLVENKLRKPHKASIINEGIDDYTLYRYDMDEEKEKFLPFFNNTNAEDGKAVEYPAPVGLRKFCDYILLATKRERLFVILIEMKSGGNDGAEIQLEAAKCFMEYVRNTAERIKDLNDYKSFSSKNICVRKVILKPAKARPGTNKAKSNKVDFTAGIVRLLTDAFPLYQFCK